MLESIVRPFARPDTLARRRIIASSVKIDVPAATISWGRAGTLPGAQQIEEIDPLGTSFTVLTCDESYDEVRGSRRTVTKRIEKADDPSIYIDVERPTEITFLKASQFPQNYNKTTTWQTNVETTGFTTVNLSNRACRAIYKLDIQTSA